MIVLKIYRRSKKSPEPSISPDVPENPPPEEKRLSARSDHVVKLKYKVLVPMEGQGFTQDMSVKGFGLFLDNEVPPGAVMELKFHKPPRGVQPVKPIAKVVWQRDHQAGVKILGK
jgi:hypothetical protein